MSYIPSRAELGEISQVYDSAQWGNKAAKEQLDRMLNKIGLPSGASRFEGGYYKE
ncbi:hypothetical protein J4427_03825 [Candidatus Woesearchaeota archaeon]|nr:hypothetical protein [Candidatus Woesearchaeota archaeon]